MFQYYIYQLMIYIASDTENLFNSFHVYQEVRFSRIWMSVCVHECVHMCSYRYVCICNLTYIYILMKYIS